jgi:hypothetical protein
MILGVMSFISHALWNSTTVSPSGVKWTIPVIGWTMTVTGLGSDHKIPAGRGIYDYEAREPKWSERKVSGEREETQNLLL